MKRTRSASQQRESHRFAAGLVVAIVVNGLGLHAIAHLAEHTESADAPPLRPSGKLTLRFAPAPETAPALPIPEQDRVLAGERTPTDPDSRSWLGSELPDLVQGFLSQVAQAALSPNPGDQRRGLARPSPSESEPTPGAESAERPDASDAETTVADERRDLPVEAQIPPSLTDPDGEELLDEPTIISAEVLVPRDRDPTLRPPTLPIPRPETTGEGELMLPTFGPEAPWTLEVSVSPPVSVRSDAPDRANREDAVESTEVTTRPPSEGENQSELDPSQADRAAAQRPQGGTPGDIAERSNREAPAASPEEPLVIKPGGVQVREGLTVRTRVAPELRDIALLGRPRRALILNIAWDANGIPRDIEILQSSGAPRIDQAWERAAWGWRAEGKRLDDLERGNIRSVLRQRFVIQPSGR